jgi:hypothetical protein
MFTCARRQVQVSEFVLRKRNGSGCVARGVQLCFRGMEATVPRDKILRHHQVSFGVFKQEILLA